MGSSCRKICMLHYFRVQSPIWTEPLRVLKQHELTTPGTGQQQDVPGRLVGRKRSYASAETLHVLDPLKMKLWSKPRQCASWLWEMCFAAQGLTYDSFFIHGESKQVDGNSCLTIGTVKARHILDPLSGEEEWREKEKKKDTTLSSF